ncbi:hypothetical protein F5Y16DRAFT_288469 [Xylariaceae sp. FL0255]|nr:hypothetical protein F5Y16DRAFT_288469 [Xylariaceae sp. FL0255]
MADNDALPDKISINLFKSLLERYDTLITSISSTKVPNKPGQKTLLELDDFRYKTAVDAFQSDSPKRSMTHDDVKALVDWKLRHGKFRPALMKLVSSNESKTVDETIQKAMAHYWKTRQIAQAVDTICKLKGIGPATASLLLSVHDPDRVIFFSDEAFWWLCCGGQKAPIKYNAKEYQQLIQAAGNIAKRLHVSATAVEKAAYVLLKNGLPENATAGESLAAESKKEEKSASSERAIPRKPAKRKEISPPEVKDNVRRSKRGKAS